MGVEIERKFIVNGNAWRKDAKALPFVQAYIPASGATVRARIAGEEAFLTIKGPSTGISRAEYEYKIPVEDATEMMATICAKFIIKKTRYFVKYKGKDWVIDEFNELNKGLIIAEVELESEDENIELPEWIAEEVSIKPQYTNSYLSQHPFLTWKTT